MYTKATEDESAKLSQIASISLCKTTKVTVQSIASRKMSNNPTHIGLHNRHIFLRILGEQR